MYSIPIVLNKIKTTSHEKKQYMLNLFAWIGVHFVFVSKEAEWVKTFLYFSIFEFHLGGSNRNKPPTRKDRVRENIIVSFRAEKGAAQMQS